LEEGVEMTKVLQLKAFCLNGDEDGDDYGQLGFVRQCDSVFGVMEDQNCLGLAPVSVAIY
jgi:hypothetical protein